MVVFVDVLVFVVVVVVVLVFVVVDEIVLVGIAEELAVDPVLSLEMLLLLVDRASIFKDDCIITIISIVRTRCNLAVIIVKCILAKLH